METCSVVPTFDSVVPTFDSISMKLFSIVSYLSLLISVNSVVFQVRVAGTLLMIEFNTLSDYLFLLRGVAECLAPHGNSVMLYLAAAVSDFYIPSQSMVCVANLRLNVVEFIYHKISSNNNLLRILSTSPN